MKHQNVDKDNICAICRDPLLIDTIDLPLIPYSNIIWKVSIGSLPMNNKIRELSPNEIANAIIGAEKLAILKLSFIFLIQSYNHLDLQGRHHLNLTLLLLILDKIQ